MAQFNPEDFRVFQGPEVPIPKKNLLSFFESQAKKSPFAIAVIDRSTDVSASYERLDQEASSLSRILTKKNGEINGHASFALVILPPSYAFIVAEIGLMKAGNVLVPLDPQLCKERIKAIWEKLKKPLVFSDKTTLKRFDFLPEKEAMAIEDIMVKLDKPGEQEIDLFTQTDHIRNPENPTICFSTSGSTGSPKLVLMKEKGLVSYLQFLTRRFNFTGQRSLFYSNPGFDMSFSQSWPSLASGGTVVIPPEGVKRDLSLLQGFIRANGINWLMLPTMVGEPLLGKLDIGQQLKVLALAGEKISKASGLLLQETLTYVVENHYGLTEACIGQTCATFKKGEKVTSSVGYPVDNMSILLDKNGEIWMSGVGICEYLDVQEGKQSFFTFQGHRFLRTGDIGRWRETGLEILGRTDDQVKVSGKRVNLGEITREILNLNLPGMVITDATNLYLNNGVYSFIVMNGNNEKTQLESISSGLKKKLPIHALPLDILPVPQPQLPLNSNGKVDKQALLSLLNEHLNRKSGHLSQNEEEIASVWRNILSLDPNQKITPSTTFYQLGGTSITAMEFLNRIKNPPFSCSLPFSLFLDDNSLGQIAKLVQETGELEDTFDPKREVEEIFSTLVDKRTFKDKVPSNPGKDILITGATGFFTPHLLHALILQLKRECNLYCMIRATDNSHAAAAQRLDSVLLKYKLPSLADLAILNPLVQIKPIIGDFSHPDFSPMSQETFQHLLSTVSVVIHAGADTHQFKSYASLKGTNSIGTRNMIQFCLSGRQKEIHFMSTYAVIEVPDEGFPERELSWRGAAGTEGYCRSKWVAEKLVSESGKRLGLPFFIYKAADIGMSTVSGRYNIIDFFYTVIRGQKELGTFPQEIDWPVYLPVDQMAPATAHIILKNISGCGVGQFYNFGKLLKGAMMRALTAQGMEPMLLPEWYKSMDEYVRKSEKVGGDLLLTWEWFTARLKDFHGDFNTIVKIINPDSKTPNTDKALEGSGIQFECSVEQCVKLAGKALKHRKVYREA